MKKKPIYMVQYYHEGGLRAQPIKADEEQAAKEKFLKLFPKHDEDNIAHIDLLEPTHKHFLILSSHAR